MDYKKKYTVIHGKILKFILKEYTIDRTNFSESTSIDYSTITQYVNGNRLPIARNEEILCNELSNIIKERRDSNANKEVVKFIISLISELSNNPSASSEPIKFIRYAISYCHSRASGLPPITTQGGYLSSNKIQIAVFDFDGTLAMNYSGITTWETIWKTVGYEIDICQKLHKEFDDNKITHQEWCDLTAKKFIEKNLHQSTLSKMALEINLIDGVYRTFEILSKQGIKIHILSGSIANIIRIVLQGLSCITEIKANEFVFNNDGYLKKIIGTPFDFDGKADYIVNLSEYYEVPTCDIFFIGNDHNDESVHRTGAMTLCINPRETNPRDKDIWDDYILSCKSLEDVIPYFDTIYDSHKKIKTPM